LTPPNLAATQGIRRVQQINQYATSGTLEPVSVRRLYATSRLNAGKRPLQGDFLQRRRTISPKHINQLNGLPKAI